MNEICLTVEKDEDFAFSLDMNDVTAAELSYNELMEINDAVKQLGIHNKGKYPAFWNRATKTLRPPTSNMDSEQSVSNRVTGYDRVVVPVDVTNPCLHPTLERLFLYSYMQNINIRERAW